METVTLQCNGKDADSEKAAKLLKVWAEVRGLTLDEAVQAFISRALWNHTRGC